MLGAATGLVDRLGRRCGCAARSRTDVAPARGAALRDRAAAERSGAARAPAPSARAGRSLPVDRRARGAVDAREPGDRAQGGRARREGVGRQDRRHRVRRSASKAAAGSRRATSSSPPHMSSRASAPRPSRFPARAPTPRLSFGSIRTTMSQCCTSAVRRARRLRYAEPQPATPVAILGYPANGPLTATPGRIGTTSTVAHPRRLRPRSGPAHRSPPSPGACATATPAGPRWTRKGVVRATIFAARLGSPSGYGIPTSIVARDAALGSAAGLDRLAAPS